MKGTIEKYPVEVQFGTMIAVAVSIAVGVWNSSTFASDIKTDIELMDKTNQLQHETLITGYNHIKTELQSQDIRIEENKDTSSVIEGKLLTLEAILLRVEDAVTN